MEFQKTFLEVQKWIAIWKLVEKFIEKILRRIASAVWRKNLWEILRWIASDLFRRILGLYSRGNSNKILLRNPWTKLKKFLTVFAEKFLKERLNVFCWKIWGATSNWFLEKSKETLEEFSVKKCRRIYGERT